MGTEFFFFLFTSLRQEARQASLVAVKMWALSRSGSILLGTRSKVHGRLHTFSIITISHALTSSSIIIRADYNIKCNVWFVSMLQLNYRVLYVGRK